MTSRTQPLLHYLRRLTAPFSKDAGDAELLNRFASQGDESAFAALLARHGPMVFGVCRRVLRNSNDAEDAFQATFLILARKAGSLRRPEALASWLYGTARHLASTARRAESRRRQRETYSFDSATPPSLVDVLDDLSARELLLALDEEMARLPDRYRLPLILCQLEGRTHEEAARLLGWTAGLVKGRLGRGRKRLHERLTRRGLALSGALLALGVSTSASASAAEQLLSATLRAALAFARGQRGGIPASVLALVETNVAALTTAKVKWGLTLLLTVGLGAGTSALFFPLKSENPTEATQEEQTPSTKAGTTKQARTDRYGDPLPPGALMRLGTLRFRVPTLLGGAYQDLPDQRTKLVHTESAIRWLESETWKEIDRWVMPRGMKVNNVSADGKLALLSDDKSLQLWDTVSRKRIQTFDYKAEHEQISAFFPPDGKTLLTHHGVNYNQTLVRVWDVATRKELWHEGVLGFWWDGIYPLGFQDDGRTLIVRQNKDNRISLRDERTGKVQRSFATMPKDDLRSFRLSPDGKTVMMGTGGQSVRSWNIASGKENPPLGGHNGQAHTFAFSNDSKSVVTGGEDSFVQVWDWPSGRLRQCIDFGSGHTGSIGFTPDRQRLEVVIWGEHALRYWDIKTGREVPPRADGHRGAVYGLAFLPSGEIITTALDGTIRVWDPASGQTLRHFPTQLVFGATKFSLSADGKTIAVADMNRPDIQLLDVATGRKLRTIETALKNCICIAFSPAGKLLASTSRPSEPGDRRSAMQLWDAATGQEVRRIDDEFCGRLAFSPDGQFLAVKHKNCVIVWTVATRQQYRSIAPKDPRGLSFSPDGRMLATGSPKDGINLWEVTSAKERLRLKVPVWDCWSETLCFSPDGRYLASAGGVAKTIYLWDTRTGELIHRFVGHESTPEALAFSADGRVLASASFDTTILLWDVAAIIAKRRMPVSTLAAKEIETSWQVLANSDSAAVYRAIWALAASPREATAFLSEHLRRVDPVEEKVISKLVFDLDSSDFATRQHASEELTKFDRVAEPALRKALTQQPSPEMRRRVQQLLEQLASIPSGTQLQQLRAVEVLEHIGTLEARQVLEKLASGTVEARLTREAKASLARLTARP
jgi:RNA polymerase sigma factor (sigma-70 family)